MRILYVHNVGKIGGDERVTLGIIRGLDKKNHQAFLVAPEDSRFLAAAREQGAEASVLGIQQPDIRKPFATLANYRLWMDYPQKNRVDIIHPGDLFVTRTLIRPADKLGISLVCEFIQRLAAKDIRLLVGLSWIDAKITKLVNDNLEYKKNDYQHRVTFVEGAGYKFESLRPWRPADIRLYINRICRYKTGQVQEPYLNALPFVEWPDNVQLLNKEILEGGLTFSQLGYCWLLRTKIRRRLKKFYNL